MLYVHVSDGSVDHGPGRLPENWRNISGLPHLSDDELAEFGWYPVNEAPGTESHQRIAEPVVTVNGRTVSVEWTVEDRALDEVKAEALEAVRADAYARIVAIAPEYRQRNLTARAVEILKEYGRDLPPEIAAEWAAGQAIWDRIAAIRTASDEAEGLIKASATAREAASVTVRWPR